MGNISKHTLQRLLLAHFRVNRAAGIRAEFLLVDGKEPNAFAWTAEGRPVIGVNLGMVELLQDDVDAFAFLMGHEAAHIVKGHEQSGRKRSATLQAIGSLVGLGLGAAGVPVGGTVAGLAVDLIDTAYSRDEEREADALGFNYATAAGYEPSGSFRLQEKLLQVSTGLVIPFLSSHPSGQERIAALKALVAEKKAASSSPVTDAQPADD
jgi:predicted Zn-dependent protease